MKGKYIFLACLVAVSGIVVGMTGAVLKYAVLEPLGLHRQEPAVALPFVFLRDEGLRYVVADLRASKVTEPTAQVTQPSATIPSHITDPTETTVEAFRRPDRILFIGDSRTCGLRDHARMDGADYFCDVGMSVFNAHQKVLSDEEFRNEMLYDLLSDREYGYVFIGLGLNEAGYPVESLLRSYRELVDQVVRAQPQAVILLQGVMAVSRDWAERAPYTTPENLSLINTGIRQVALDYRVCYLDTNKQFADESGYLPEKMTADGCHLYAKYTHLWAKWLMDEAKRT